MMALIALSSEPIDEDGHELNVSENWAVWSGVDEPLRAASHLG